MSDLYDLIIVGSGPGGLSAGIYGMRAALKTLLIEKGVAGGQVNLSDEVENYPGFPEGILGPELMERFEAQAVRFGAEVRYGTVTATARPLSGPLWLRRKTVSPEGNRMN